MERGNTGDLRQLVGIICVLKWRQLTMHLPHLECGGFCIRRAQIIHFYAKAKRRKVDSDSNSMANRIELFLHILMKNRKSAIEFPIKHWATLSPDNYFPFDPSASGTMCGTHRETENRRGHQTVEMQCTTFVRLKFTIGARHQATRAPTSYINHLPAKCWSKSLTMTICARQRNIDVSWTLCTAHDCMSMTFITRFSEPSISQVPAISVDPSCLFQYLQLTRDRVVHSVR